MLTGPKYKIARRLGAPIFEKTQTQKYALHLERRGKSKGFSKPKSEYGLQLIEKQKARFIYGLGERQFANAVKAGLSNKSGNPTQNIFELLETRLDSVVYRLGLTTTRSGARQMVSHGHISVNGRRVNTPSLRVKVGDKIEIAARSQNKGLFTTLDERMKDITVPSWLKFDAAKRTAEIMGMPIYIKTENMFDLNTVIEFYSR
jgi:small subunit ribosomal protein S4